MKQLKENAKSGVVTTIIGIFLLIVTTATIFWGQEFLTDLTGMDKLKGIGLGYGIGILLILTPKKLETFVFGWLNKKRDE